MHGALEIAKEYRQRLAKFISEYVDITDCKLGYGDDDVIKQSIRLLLNEGIFTASDLKKEALKEYNIMITDLFIEECLKS